MKKITKLLQNVGCVLTFTGHVSESLLYIFTFRALNDHLEDAEHEQENILRVSSPLCAHLKSARNHAKAITF